MPWGHVDACRGARLWAAVEARPTPSGGEGRGPALGADVSFVANHLGLAGAGPSRVTVQQIARKVGRVAGMPFAGCRERNGCHGAVVSGTPEGEGVDPESLGRAGWGLAVTRRVARRTNEKPRLLRSGSAAPGPRLWSRAPTARRLRGTSRPHPPHGGAASAYTSTGSAVTSWQASCTGRGRGRNHSRCPRRSESRHEGRIRRSRQPSPLSLGDALAVGPRRQEARCRAPETQVAPTSWRSMQPLEAATRSRQRPCRDRNECSIPSPMNGAPSPLVEAAAIRLPGRLSRKSGREVRVSVPAAGRTTGLSVGALGCTTIEVLRAANPG